MKTTNIPAGSQRMSSVGLVWEEVITGGADTFRVKFQQSFRVSATLATTVTIDGVLAMTMQAGEVEIFCAGTGAGSDDRSTVEVIIAGGANVQVAKDIETGRRTR